MKSNTIKLAVLVMACMVLIGAAPLAEAVNLAPVVDAGSDEYKAAIFYTTSALDRTVVATATDDYTITNYTWSMDSGPSTGVITWGAQWALNTSIVASIEGSYRLNLTCTDNESAASYDTFVLVWDTTAPTVEAGSNENKNAVFTSTDRRHRTTVTSATDSGSGIANYTWSMDSGPSTGTVAWGAQWALNTTINASLDGTYVLNITVTDNAGNTAYDTFTLVLDDTAPSITTVTPADNTVNYPVASGTYVFYFSEAMNTTKTGFTSNLPGKSGSWSASGRYFNITYYALDDETAYYVNFTGHGHIDLFANALGGDMYKTFTTTTTAGSNTYTPPPTLDATADTPPPGESTEIELGVAFWVGGIFILLGLAHIPLPFISTYVKPFMLVIGGVILILWNFL